MNTSESYNANFDQLREEVSLSYKVIPDILKELGKTSVNELWSSDDSQIDEIVSNMPHYGRNFVGSFDSSLSLKSILWISNEFTLGTLSRHSLVYYSTFDFEGIKSESALDRLFDQVELAYAISSHVADALWVENRISGVSLATDDQIKEIVDRIPCFSREDLTSFNSEMSLKDIFRASADHFRSNHSKDSLAKYL